MAIQNIRKETANNKKLNIDINCDLGQSFGVYKTDIEQELLPYVRSVNIACGLHAGDPLTIKNALELASKYNLAVGAHVGYPDIQGFGYRSMNLNEEEMQAIIVYQIGALTSLAKVYNVDIEYVRPHGALYKQISEDYETFLSLAKAVASYDPWLVLVAPVCENAAKVSEEANLRIAQEIQLDKQYKVDGSIDFDADEIVDFNQQLRLLDALLQESVVLNNQQGRTKVDFKTIHLSMKRESSVQLARRVSERIETPVPVTGTFVANSGWLE